MAKSTGIPLDLLVKDAVEAVKIVDSKVSLLEMATEFKRRKMHELPDKMLPVAVDEMIETRTKDGTGDAYVRVLKVYLNQLNCGKRANYPSVAAQRTQPQPFHHHRLWAGV
jgi:hypothetical protein